MNESTLQACQIHFKSFKKFSIHLGAFVHAATERTAARIVAVSSPSFLFFLFFFFFFSLIRGGDAPDTAILPGKDVDSDVLARAIAAPFLISAQVRRNRGPSWMSLCTKLQIFYFHRGGYKCAPFERAEQRRLK